jgi:hypothetical protein
MAIAGSPIARSAFAGSPVAGAPTQKPQLSRHIKVAIGAVLGAAVLAASAFMFFDKAAPVSLPASAGGLPAVTELPASSKAQLKEMEKGLAKGHIHDVSSRVYGDVTGGGMLVVAGRVAKADMDMDQASALINGERGLLGPNASAGLVTSGSTQFECLSQNAPGHSLAMCFWWSQHAILFAYGADLDAQTTADALAEMKAYASLH